jgi:hypothetical protein
MKARTGDTITPGDGRQERRGDADERAHLAAEILSVRQRPRITVYIDGFNLYYALLKPDPAVR